MTQRPLRPRAHRDSFRCILQLAVLYTNLVFGHLHSIMPSTQKRRQRCEQALHFLQSNSNRPAPSAKNIFAANSPRKMRRRHGGKTGLAWYLQNNRILGNGILSRLSPLPTLRGTLLRIPLRSEEERGSAPCFSSVAPAATAPWQCDAGSPP